MFLFSSFIDLCLLFNLLRKRTIYVKFFYFFYSDLKSDFNLYANESCVFMASCILPCSFQGGSDVVIQWFQLEAGILVHSFFYNKDQLTQQDQRFRNRTSLFTDQISGGNASLQLTGLQVQDQGRYKCYTSSNREKHISFINLRVDGEKHIGKVDLQQVGNRITCSSERIYPEPELTWSTSPPSTLVSRQKINLQLF
uniref:Ig-like domain-containing protein n=1 Tax=Seriola lalandi dorsalis TaxID=1841481 RepID=A0A3B4YE38_SERLL